MPFSDRTLPDDMLFTSRRRSTIQIICDFVVLIGPFGTKPGGRWAREPSTNRGRDRMGLRHGTVTTTGRAMRMIHLPLDQIERILTFQPNTDILRRIVFQLRKG